MAAKLYAELAAWWPLLSPPHEYVEEADFYRQQLRAVTPGAQTMLRETFRTGSDHGGTDSPDGRGLRYLEWVWDPDPTDTTYLVDYAFLVRTADGHTTVEHDRHVEGLFARETWLELLAEAGFTASTVATPWGAAAGAMGEIFVGRRNA